MSVSEKALKYFKPIEERPEDEQKPLRLIKEKERQEYLQGINKLMAEYIRRSEKLRIEINHDIKAGKDVNEILDKALKCISLMTGDELFYKQNKKTY